MDWFKHEARRVYAMLSESDEARDHRQLIEWIQRKGGSVAVRELQQGHRRYKTAESAKAALDGLAEAGYGDWRPVLTTAKGGRPTQAFHLPQAVYGTSANHHKPDKTGLCSSVDCRHGRKHNPRIE